MECIIRGLIKILYIHIYIFPFFIIYIYLFIGHNAAIGVNYLASNSEFILVHSGNTTTILLLRVVGSTPEQKTQAKVDRRRSDERVVSYISSIYMCIDKYLNIDKLRMFLF